jgi:hypothetical protein
MSLIISEIPKLLEPPKVEQYDTEDSKDFGKESVMAFPNLISVEIPSEKHLIVSQYLFYKINKVKICSNITMGNQQPSS